MEANSDNSTMAQVREPTDLQDRAAEESSHIQALVTALADSSSEVLKSAVEALEKNGVSALPVLIQALSHRHLSVRRLAAETLGNIGDVAALPALIQVLTDAKPNRYDDLDYEMRQTAVKAMGKVGRPAVPT